MANNETEVHSVPTLTQEEEHVEPTAIASKGKSRAFYMSFLAICVTTFLSALDLTAVGTALPTIADALHDTQGEFTWVGSAYALSSTAFIPLSGSLADAFGRRPITLISIAFFAVGSAIAGAAQNMQMLIAARAVQGVGGGGILALSEILVADLVPLAERGIYQGMVGLVWSFASSIGPPIGGALASVDHKAWRWLFYLNLPVSGFAFILVVVYLNVRRPEGSTRTRLAQVDWMGNAMVITGSGLAIIGLAWGGIRYPWDSVQTLAPLVIGLSMLVAFAVYEAKVPTHPTIPLDVIGNRTSLSGLLATAVHAITSISVIYYMPVYFQACFGASPIRSAVDVLPGALVTAPMALVAGAAITVLKKYRLTNYLSWAILIASLGIITMLRADTSTAKWVGYQILLGAGIGMLFAAPIFPILAPLPNNRSASALALFTFTRAFFQAWGITISSTVLQNELRRKLPAEFVARFPPGFEIAYIAIPVIRQLPEPLKQEVRTAFALSMSTIWQVMTGIAGLGLLSCLLMQEIPMDTTVDETYALKDDDAKKSEDVEKRQ
ncbi:MFS domain-containing protein [Mycena indigotica]|uniref:MFS domain-containing protein n=1 Tax=Mycena indigotica TaxID=2126181 RepID=A0A8H6SKZ4_9AGAR|nr:MFS domain-containing protein [Mycena indigotica]KAF7301264.1 MFS domain-containing protein [Mycena indigotica]